MKRKYKRIGFTAAQKAELWDRWQKGEGLKSIGRAFGKGSSSIYGHLSPYGGIRPPPRRRCRRTLALSEREEISRGLVTEQSFCSIAASLPSFAIDSQPGDKPQWWLQTVSGGGSG